MSAQQAGAEVSTEHVTATLVASVNAVYPGARVVLGVNQRIIPHWHTYWQNSGDSGIPTSIDWQLPQGGQAGAIDWPIPSRFHLGTVTNYGYENEVTLLTPLQVPDDLKPGSRYQVTAKVDWLVCQESCVPEQVTLQLDLPVVATAADAGKGSPLIARAQATLPQASPWQAVLQQSKGAPASSFDLRLSGNGIQPDQLRDAYFYPLQWGRILHNIPQPRADEENSQDDSDKSSGSKGSTGKARALVLRLQIGEAPLPAGEAFSGVLVVTEQTKNGVQQRGYLIDVPAEQAQAAAVQSQPGQAASVDAGSPSTTQSADSAGADSAGADTSAGLGLATALLLALLGGMVLNLMPCVFPVLSIKALSLLQHAHQGALQTRLHGLAYTAGILASFGLLAGLLIALKAGGAQIGWGFQFQSPLFVLAVAYLMFAVGLSLSGVFSLGGSVTGIGSSLAERSGYSGSFFTGVLATIVATPCTAPFMGAALGYALAQPPLGLLAVFLSLGLGLALPYLLLSAWPLLQRWLPRPGLWMERVKQLLAFPMYIAAVWLVWVLAQQAGANAIALALGGMVVLAFAAWVYDISRSSQGARRIAANSTVAVALTLTLVGGYVGIERNAASPVIADQTHADSEPYSAQRLAELRAQGKPVFLNFTAAWCISCLANERVALSSPAVKQAFQQAGITYLKGDWTSQDQQITAFLKSFGRSGVPLYVSYPAGNNSSPVVLPQILTPEIVVQAVAPIAPSQL